MQHPTHGLNYIAGSIQIYILNAQIINPLPGLHCESINQLINKSINQSNITFLAHKLTKRLTFTDVIYRSYY
jgi:hypothetical protein